MNMHSFSFKSCMARLNVTVFTMNLDCLVMQDYNMYFLCN